MPFWKEINLDSHTRILIWHITETVPQLRNLISAHTQITDRPEHHNTHWLSSRQLVYEYFKPAYPHVDIYKDEYGKPHVNIDGYCISITHSFEYAAIIISSSNAVAIDLEKFDQRIQRVAHKFMSDEELVMLEKELEMEYLTTIWSAKETLYKMYGKKELIFKEHLHVHPFKYNPSGRFDSHISKGIYHHSLKIHYCTFGSYILTYAIS